jgi:hypothetical protein
MTRRAQTVAYASACMLKFHRNFGTTNYTDLSAKGDAALLVGTNASGAQANLLYWSAPAPAPVPQASYQLSGLEDLSLSSTQPRPQNFGQSLDDSSDGFALLSDLALPQVAETSSQPCIHADPPKRLSTKV